MDRHTMVLNIGINDICKSWRNEEKESPAEHLIWVCFKLYEIRLAIYGSKNFTELADLADITGGAQQIYYSFSVVSQQAIW